MLGKESQSGTDKLGMNPLLIEALKYVQFGWYVVPLHSVDKEGFCSCDDPHCKVQGKHPRIERESDFAYLRGEGSRKIRQIEEWWNEWPDSNIAICCGGPSNLVAIDIDPRNDGFTSLAELESEYGNFSDTLKSETGGGGLHLLFTHPQTEKVRNRIGLYPGIDVKADGGRIVAPPSNHSSGNLYKWSSPFQTTKISDLPDWLLETIQTKKGTGTWQAMRK